MKYYHVSRSNSSHTCRISTQLSLGISRSRSNDLPKSGKFDEKRRITADENAHVYGAINYEVFDEIQFSTEYDLSRQLVQRKQEIIKKEESVKD